LDWRDIPLFISAGYSVSSVQCMAAAHIFTVKIAEAVIAPAKYKVIKICGRQSDHITGSPYPASI
jgi:hypothetical protein